jgi:hypothetical protein
MGYNAQAVATEDQIIVAAEVTTDENDVGQLHSMLTATAHELKAAGVEGAVGAALADAGYCSEEKLAAVAPRARSCSWRRARTGSSGHR